MTDFVPEMIKPIQLPLFQEGFSKSVVALLFKNVQLFFFSLFAFKHQLHAIDGSSHPDAAKGHDHTSPLNILLAILPRASRFFSCAAAEFSVFIFTQRFNENLITLLNSLIVISFHLLRCLRFGRKAFG